MKGFSKAIIAGNLTRDPEMRSTPSGASVCSFTVAVNRSYKGSDGNMQENTSFIDCSAWGRPAETICQYMHKGSGILVSGRLEQHSWEDKETKQRRSRVEIVVEDFNFVGGDQNGGGSYGGGSRGGSNYSNSNNSNPPMSDAGMASDAAPADIPDNVDLTDIPF